ncbi:amidohydrolase family protein, partial [Flavobacteriaceae bacterium]|nr:amidohydrolase family protein [Flavobacteriaceae bacterium]
MKSVFKAMLLLLIGATSCTNHNADLIIHNARIYTVNDSFELASSLVVKDGKFIAVGNEDLLEKYSAAAKLDLKGIPVYPGLIDAHCHFYQLGLAQEHVDLRGAKSVEEVIARLKAFASTSEAKVLMGRGWDQNLWELKEFPSKEILDKAFPDKLVVLERVDGHAAYVNSNVLTAAKITKDT